MPLLKENLAVALALAKVKCNRVLIFDSVSPENVESRADRQIDSVIAQFGYIFEIVQRLRAPGISGWDRAGFGQK
jgi:hypothetical protein